MAYITSYIAALLTFVVADIAWLGVMSSRLYKPTLDDILLDRFSVLPAAVFYLLYPIGLVIFAIAPALRGGNLLTAVQMGALFGLFTYGTYDLTNQATLRSWTTSLTIVDVAWGTVLGAMTAASAYWVTTRFVA